MSISVAHLELLVEESSSEAALRNLVPAIVGSHVSFRIHAHQGKPDLLAKLPNRLKGYRNWLPDDWRIVVLIDEDREDCTKAKGQLEDIAAQAGLVTKSAAKAGEPFHVLNRLCVEELEAWFFGDVKAVVSAYPRVPHSLAHRAGFRNSDAIVGGTWEALERVLQRAGYHRGGLEKVRAATEISQYMDPQRNASKSFQVFRTALISLNP